jgi:hypothetical protein
MISKASFKYLAASGEMMGEVVDVIAPGVETTFVGIINGTAVLHAVSMRHKIWTNLFIDFMAYLPLLFRVNIPTLRGSKKPWGRYSLSESVGVSLLVPPLLRWTQCARFLIALRYPLTACVKPIT